MRIQKVEDLQTIHEVNSQNLYNRLTIDLAE